MICEHHFLQNTYLILQNADHATDIINGGSVQWHGERSRWGHGMTWTLREWGPVVGPVLDVECVKVGSGGGGSDAETAPDRAR
jgi:hypothetical protein